MMSLFTAIKKIPVVGHRISLPLAFIVLIVKIYKAS
jgi:hypothetical protein